MLYNPGQIILGLSVKTVSEVSTELNKITDTEYIEYAKISYCFLIPVQPCLITASISIHDATEAQN